MQRGVRRRPGRVAQLFYGGRRRRCPDARALLGRTVIHEPIAIGTDGRLAVAQDPTGAAFTLWEPRDHFGAQVSREPGALAWAELYTRDTEAAASFYGGLFGWTSKAVQP